MDLLLKKERQITMKFEDLLIYTDVDGTAATHENRVGIVSKKNLEAIKEFIKEGGQFGVASGRNHVSIDQIFPGIEINLPYIEANGAAVWDKETQSYLSIHYIDQEFKKKIYQFIKDRPNLTMTAMGKVSKKVVFGDERDEWIIDYPREMMSYEEFMDTSLLKCAILAEKENIELALKDLKQVDFLKGITSSRTADIYVEFFHCKASKGEGIRTVLSRREDLKRRKLVCIGDFYNDISMLEIADIAICPANAVEEVREICDHIAVSNDKDTIADVLTYLRGLYE